MVVVPGVMVGWQNYRRSGLKNSIKNRAYTFDKIVLARHGKTERAIARQ
ncbi:hypothetical protein PITCH_A1650005 [uncultured Desulfobacterium sp.]|uniref:Uncharacterized protein n=1 Tax=uncultured Desulfobacterium sp. TaxID=201089 RepID=A0A445MUH1_9BACT|nr:hypothetical protein PITCH_A1650005 [uncultured Desulfobacterium sp.]